MINLIAKFNNYFILSVFLISVLAFQFGFVNTSSTLYISSINIFLIISILICVSTKNIKKIILPVLIISFISSVYDANNVFVSMFSYSLWAVIVFYLNKGPLFITDYYRFSILIILSLILFKVILFVSAFVFGYFYYHQIILPDINTDFMISLLFQIIYSIIILFVFKPDVKYINYEFLVGD